MTTDSSIITSSMIQNDIHLAIRLHREMWSWLSRQPNKGKMNWPRWKCNGGDVEVVHQLCFMCVFEMSLDAADKDSCVYNCPLSWGNPSAKFKSGCCYLKTKTRELGCGIYIRWSATNDLNKRRQLAWAIANLPVNDKYIPHLTEAKNPTLECSTLNNVELEIIKL